VGQALTGHVPGGSEFGEGRLVECLERFKPHSIPLKEFRSRGAHPAQDRRGVVGELVEGP
jgi:hypothetical protein